VQPVLATVTDTRGQSDQLTGLASLPPVEARSRCSATVADYRGQGLTNDVVGHHWPVEGGGSMPVIATVTDTVGTLTNGRVGNICPPVRRGAPVLATVTDRGHTDQWTCPATFARSRRRCSRCSRR